MNENLFSYGTLQNEETQQKLFGRILKGVGDVLEGYKVSSIQIFDECFLSMGEDKNQKTLVPTGICGDFVEGMLYEVSKKELDLAETIETANYIKIKVKLKSGNAAWVFIAM